MCVVGDIVHTAYVFDVEDLEYVVETKDQFYIGRVGIHHVGGIGEGAVRAEGARIVEEGGVAPVLHQEGVVLVRELAPEAVHSDIFAPLQSADEGDAVQYLAVHVPRHHERGVAVVGEFHVADEAEGVSLHDVAHVGGRHDEEGVGHLVPLYASLEHEVHLTP